MQKITALIACTLALLLGNPAARADEKTDKRFEDARAVFESFTNLSEQGIPDWLLNRAYGVVVAPRVFEIAVLGGGRGGRGVLAVRNPDGSWSDPVLLNLIGGSFGFQFGMHMTDVVLVLMSRKSVEGISGGKFMLGADASVVAGPVGRTASAGTDVTLKAQVLSYSRSEGVFLGAALEGTVLAVDDEANATAYGVSGILPSQILSGKGVNPPPAARNFVDALTRATDRAAASEQPSQQPHEAAPSPEPGTTSAPAGETAAAPTGTPASQPAAPKSGSPAQTYPMEDQKPGAPPPP